MYNWLSRAGVVPTEKETTPLKIGYLLKSVARGIYKQVNLSIHVFWMTPCMALLTNFSCRECV